MKSVSFTSSASSPAWLRRLRVYGYVWSKIASYALMETFLNRWTSLLFLMGKCLRFAVTLAFLLALQQGTTHFAGYTTGEVMVFFLIYQTIDTLSQVLWRGVYLFSWQVRSGDLDMLLSKPLNALFRILTGKPDIIDAIFFVPTTLLGIWLTRAYLVLVTPAQWGLFFLLFINGMFISTAFHIFVVCIGIVTTEVDNAIMLFRDTNNMARFPIDVYREPFRAILMFVIPIGVMNTIPAQVLLGSGTSAPPLLAFAIGIGALAASLWFWSWSVRKYTSAGG